MKLNRAGYGPAIRPLVCACARFALTASIAFATGLLSRPVAQAGDDPGELRAYVGKYPFDRVRGRSLLQVPELRARLQTLVGGRGVNDIDQMNTVAPIEQHSGWLVASGCRPHNCGSERWAVAVNLANYNVLVCIGLEDEPVKFAGTGRGIIELPRKEDDPCPEASEALPVFQRVFSAPL